jgi:type IV pilus assembly protein PilQ
MKQNKLISVLLVISVLASFGAPGWAEYEVQRISMDFEDAPLKNVIKILSQQSGLNFVASEEIENKRVTLFLQDVPLREALDAIIKANNLRYEQEGDSSVYVVYPSDSAKASGTLLTKVFHIRHMRFSISPLDVGGQAVIDRLEQEEAQLTGVGTAGALASSSSDSPSTTTPTSTSAPAGTTGQIGQQSALMASRGIDKIVASLLSNHGKVSVDVHSNSIIVTDTAQKLKEIEEVIRQLDVPSEQVMIEVYVIEVSKSYIGDIGVDWGGADGSLLTFSGGSRSTGFPFHEKFLDGVDAASTAKSALTLGTFSAADLKATLRFLVRDTDAKILARPRVLTLNNEAAHIKLITNAAIASTTTTTGGSGIPSQTTNQAERTEVGINLKMTPQISREFVSLFVEPAVTTIQRSVLSSDFLDPTTRSVRTMARLKDNETLVIGGLIDSNKVDSIKKMPGFGDIPWIGEAFKYHDNNDVDRELLIFITPHVVKGHDSLAARSATRQGPELAVKRMLEPFKEKELRDSVAPLEKIETDKKPVILEEQELIRQAAKHSSNPGVTTAIDQSLGSFNQRGAVSSP